MLLDNILVTCPQKIFAKKIKQIKKKYSFKSKDTMQSIRELCSLLYIVDQEELALQVANLIDKLEYKGDMRIWMNVSGVLTVESLIYAKRGENEKVKICRKTIEDVYLYYGDEDKQRINMKVFKRVMNGEGFYLEEIKRVQDSGDLKLEIFWRFLQFEELLYMRVMGGSEAYPIEKLDSMIEEEKQFIAMHIDKASF
ncbi:MAG: hypothetical protein HG457_000525 [Flavobacteriaceae bacterium]|jgi:hypothetical protein|nr:hypothetical protein [Flavobacteriaceae bacterium]